MPPRCSPRTTLYSPPASCSHPQCCTACAASVTRRILAALRHSSFTAAPLTTAPLAPLAHRGAARLRAHHCATRSAPARSPPTDAPHATSPLAHRLTSRAARSPLPVASRRSIRAHPAPRCLRTASRPLAPLASAPLAHRVTHRATRRHQLSPSLRAICLAARSALGSAVSATLCSAQSAPPLAPRHLLRPPIRPWLRRRPRSAPPSAPSTAPASAPRHRLRPPAPRHCLRASLRAICFAHRSALGSVVGSAAGSTVGSAFRSVPSSAVGSAPSAPPFRPWFRRRPRPLLRPRRAPQLGSAAHAGVGYPALCYLFDRRRCPALLCARSRLRCSRLLPRGCAQPRDCALPSRSGCGELPTAEPPPGTRHHAHDHVNTPRRAAAVVEELLLRAGDSGCRQELLLRAVNTTHADTRHADTFTRHAARGTRLRGTRVHPFGRLVAMLLAFVPMTSAASSPPSSPPPPKLCNNTCLSCFGNGDSLPRQHGPRERTRLRGTRYAAHVYAAHVSTLLAGSLQCCWRSSP